MRTIFLRSRAAHQRVVDQDDAFARDRGAVGRMLHAHAEFADALGRLDEGAADIVVSDDPEFVRHAGKLAVAEGGRHAGIGHRHHDIDLGVTLAGQLRAERLADFVDRTAADDRIRPREIDVFEDAGPWRYRRKGFVDFGLDGLDSMEHDDFAGFDVTDIFRADDVERAGFRRKNRTAVEFAENERTDAPRITRSDQFLVSQRHQRIGALESPERFDIALDETAAPGLRDQMQDRLGVGGRLHQGAVAYQFATQRQSVGEVAVVGNGEAAGIEFGEQRLHIPQDGAPGGGVAGVADSGAAGEAFDYLAAGEGVTDKAEPAFRVKAVAIEGHDAGSFLAAMLKCVKAKRSDRGGFGMAEDAEHAAFLAERVAVKIEIQVDIGFGRRGVAGKALLTVHCASLFDGRE